MSFVIKIRGLDETIKSLGEIDKIKIPFAIQAGLEKSSFFVWRTLSRNTPVDTGRLRSSNHRIIDSQALTARIGPDQEIAPYATWVEHGHHTRSGSWVPGQHYIMRTYLETRSGVQKIFLDAIKIALQ